MFRQMVISLVLMLMMSGVVGFLMIRQGRLRGLGKDIGKMKLHQQHPGTISLLESLLGEEDFRSFTGQENPADRIKVLGANSIGDQATIGSGSNDLVVATGTVYNQDTINTIQKLSIDENLKQEMIRNYKRTGEIPGLDMKATAVSPPAAERAPAQNDNAGNTDELQGERSTN